MISSELFFISAHDKSVITIESRQAKNKINCKKKIYNSFGFFNTKKAATYLFMKSSLCKMQNKICFFIKNCVIIRVNAGGGKS